MKAIIVTSFSLEEIYNELWLFIFLDKRNSNSVAALLLQRVNSDSFNILRNIELTFFYSALPDLRARKLFYPKRFPPLITIMKRPLLLLTIPLAASTSLPLSINNNITKPNIKNTPSISSPCIYNPALPLAQTPPYIPPPDTSMKPAPQSRPPFRNVTCIGTLISSPSPSTTPSIAKKITSVIFRIVITISACSIPTLLGEFTVSQERHQSTG